MIICLPCLSSLPPLGYRFFIPKGNIVILDCRAAAEVSRQGTEFLTTQDEKDGNGEFHHEKCRWNGRSAVECRHSLLL